MRIYRGYITRVELHELIEEVQRASIDTALMEAKSRLNVVQVLCDQGYRQAAGKHRTLAFAYLNRACELACVPLHLWPVETAQGTEMAWYSYAPRAIASSASSVPSAAIMLGYESSMPETEARSRAIGW